MAMRAMTTCLTAALMVAPASVGNARRAPAIAAEGKSPVRCNLADGNDRVSGGKIRTARQGSMPVPMVAPPPPPAPPAPPPPPLVMAPAGNIAVTSSRVGAPALRRTPMPGYLSQPQPPSAERYAGRTVAAVRSVADAPVSTFSVDVDTGAYANVRRMLTAGQLPPSEAVRTEELLNYFRYDYPRPADRTRPFSVTADVATTPWNATTRLLRVGLRGYDVTTDGRPPANLVFLVDVSGSMDSPDKLPLVKASLGLLADRLTPRDRVSIVVYAGAAGIVLEPTSQARYVRQALDCLSVGGSTAGGAGIALAYDTARANRIAGGINRVILASDGDFNVGTSSDEGLEALVKRNRDDGITLTTLGFGTGNYNEAAMEKIADVGNGNYAYIDGADEARKVLDDELSATLFTIAKDVKLQIEFNPAVVSQYRLIGYENRALAEEDFANDAVDAGDIGAGHQVTALYEIVPTGTPGWRPDRRYEANRSSPTPSTPGGELAWLKLRYKLPTGGASSLIEQPVASGAISAARAPAGDFAFAAAVAAYGQRLRGDKYLGDFGFADVRGLAGDPADPLRRQFVALTQAAERARPAS